MASARIMPWKLPYGASKKKEKKNCNLQKKNREACILRGVLHEVQSQKAILKFIPEGWRGQTPIPPGPQTSAGEESAGKLLNSSASQDQRHKEHDEKDDEQDFGDACRSSGNAAKSQCGGNKGHDQKNQTPA
jgi:hypothetical protein